ncbi:MAG: hypothetical protein QOC59_612 [Microbacteriaceae bacterium]|jgi:peptidoglycan/LPS O-acetylase OafA/YrhL|nr:hypothetical protein [Microbacteriaceae bacterium]
MVWIRRRRGSVVLPAIGAVLGGAVGAVVGHAIRMTVRPKYAVGDPNYGIHGALAGALWGTLLGLLAEVVRQRSVRQIVGAVGILGLALALTVFDPK